MLTFRARVDLRAMAMKGCSAFPKAPASPEPHHQIVKCHIHDTRGEGSYSSAVVQLVYSTVPDDWAKQYLKCYIYFMTPRLGTFESIRWYSFRERGHYHCIMEKMYFAPFFFNSLLLFCLFVLFYFIFP